MSDEPVYATRAKVDWELIPQGPIQAVVFRVFNLGLQPSRAKGGDPGYKCSVYFETAFRYTKGEYKGKRAMVWQEYFISLGAKSYLRRDVQRILGRELTKEELEPGQFNFRCIEGINCIVNIIHKPWNDSVFPNVDGVLPPMAGSTPLKVETDPTYIPKRVAKLLEQRLPIERERDTPDAKIDPDPNLEKFEDDIPF